MRPIVALLVVAVILVLFNLPALRALQVRAASTSGSGAPAGTAPAPPRLLSGGAIPGGPVLVP